MISDLTERVVVPFRWVAVDESYGKSPVFLEGIEAIGKWYVAEVPSVHGKANSSQLDVQAKSRSTAKSRCNTNHRCPTILYLSESHQGH
jgi:hypothetical protein